MRLLADILKSILEAAQLRPVSEPISGQRIETVPVATVGNDGRYTVNIVKGGDVKVTGRNPGYAVGDEVQVVTEGGTPLAIVGHQMLKAQFHPTGGEGIWIEELIATNDASDGGVDYWLRSPNGLFYLDVRALAEEAGVPAEYVADRYPRFPNGTRFPTHLQVYGSNTPHMIFGQADNQFAILTWSLYPDYTQEWAVLYVFEINRPLHSTETPSDGFFPRDEVNHPKLAFRLVGHYILSEIDLDPGIAVVSRPTISCTQYLPVEERSTYSNYVPPRPDGTGDYYKQDNGATTVDDFYIDTMVTGSKTETMAYSVLFNAQGHGRFIADDPDAMPYYTSMMYWWVDPDGHPVLVWTWENRDRVFVLIDPMGYYSDVDGNKITGRLTAGTMPDPSRPIRSMAITSNFFPHAPLVVIRLNTASSDPEGLTAVKIGQSCEDSILIATHHEEPFNLGSWTTTKGPNPNPLYGYRATRTTHHDVGGPRPSVSESWWTTNLGHDLRWWQLYPFDDWWPGLTRESGYPGKVFPDFTVVWGTMSEVPTNKPMFTQFAAALPAPIPLFRPGYMYVGDYPSTSANTGEISLKIWEHLAGWYRGVVSVIGGRTLDGSPDDFALLLGLGESYFSSTGKEHIVYWKKVTPTAQAAGGESVTALRSWHNADKYSGYGPFVTVPSLTRDHALLEYPVWLPREVFLLKTGKSISVKTELGVQDQSKRSNDSGGASPQWVSPLSILAPDRLYDNREAVQRLLSPVGGTPVLSTPKVDKLRDVSFLDGHVFNLGMTGSSSIKENYRLGPQRMLHTVGKKTNLP